MRRLWIRLAVLSLLLMLLAGCDYWVYQVEPTATPAPPPPPGSACSVLSNEQLQLWLDEEVPRSEQEVPGGVVYLATPQVANCDDNTAYLLVRVGYQRDDMVIELGLTEMSFNLRYDADQGQVCLDVVGALAAPKLSPEGVEQVGQSILVGEAQAKAAPSASLDQMPAATRQQFDEAVSAKATISGEGAQVQGIGGDAAGILMDWAVDGLWERLNTALARLIGACISL